MLENPGFMLHLIPPLLMIGVIAANHALHHRRGRRQSADEAERFAAALRAELQALGRLYTLNLGLLRRDEGYVLSSKSSTMVYKGNIGRLAMMLDKPLIEEVVALYARNEQIEAMLAACAKPTHGLCYRLPPTSDFAQLRRMYRDASGNAVRVCELLEGAAPSVPARGSEQPPLIAAPQEGVETALPARIRARVPAALEAPENPLRTNT